MLNWREMTARYPAARMLLQEGSDHAISAFGTYVEDVLAFVQQRGAPASVIL